MVSFTSLITKYPLKQAYTAGLRGILCLLQYEGRPSSAGLWLCYMPMHDVAPSAVTIAVATDAIICTINLNVSLFVMVDKLLG